MRGRVPFALRGRWGRAPVASSSRGRNERCVAGRARKARFGASPEPSGFGRNGFRGFPATLRGARGGIEAPSPPPSIAAGASLGANGWRPLPPAPAAARPLDATALPRLAAPNPPRPAAPLSFDRPLLERPAVALRPPTGFCCRTAFQSRRRMTSDKGSSCPCFMSLSACANGASSLRLICCHLSDIPTFPRPMAAGPLVATAGGRTLSDPSAAVSYSWPWRARQSPAEARRLPPGPLEQRRQPAKR